MICLHQRSRSVKDCVYYQTRTYAKKKTVDRPHILRDKLRQEKYSLRHAIRRVTKEKAKIIPKTQEESVDANGVKIEAEPRQKMIEINPKFANLNVMEPILNALTQKSFFDPTDIQIKAIPMAIKGHNIVGSSETGSGKTAAYLIPLLHRLHIFLQRERAKLEALRVAGDEDEVKKATRMSAPLAIIVCPSGELVEQVLEETFSFAKELPSIKVMGISGALKTKSTQVKELEKGVDILVTTPGRLLTLIKNRKVLKPNIITEKKENHRTNNKTQDEIEDEVIDEAEEQQQKPTLKKEENEETDIKEKKDVKEIWEYIPGGYIDLSHVKILVLDEVDKMLDMGHMPDIKNLFQNLPSAKMPLKGEKTHMQVMMFTATLMPKIMNLISRFAPQNDKIDLNWDMKPPTEIHSVLYQVTSRRKHSLLAYLLRRKGSLRDKKVLVFARTGQRVINLAESLLKDGIKAQYIHRRLSLSARRSAVDGFRDNNYQVLISTDLMARGMDIPDIYCVVNYDVPFVPEEYLHRIGRVGRMGRSGLAITFVSKSLETVEVANRVVQIDENEYIKKIEELLGKKILVSKIPGPFQDVAKFPERELLRERTGKSILEEKAEETKQKYLDKNHRIVDNAKKIKNWNNRTTREREAQRITHKKTHSLRDFEEGRYENFVLSLEAKKNRKEGIVVPPNYTEILKKMDEKLKLKREMKKEKMRSKEARE